MNSLEDSIMVIVDCSRDQRAQPRRPLHEQQGPIGTRRLSESNSESELTLILRGPSITCVTLENSGAVRMSRRKLEDSKPLVDVMESIIRKSPSVAHLLGRIGPLSDPFKSTNGTSAKKFLGKSHPSFFRFRNKDYGEELYRQTARNMRSRIQFETDAVNDYFSRDQYAGKRTLKSRDGNLLNSDIPAYSLNLSDGVATLNLALPGYAKVGDVFQYILLVEDETMVEPFVNSFAVSVGPNQAVSGGNGKGQKRGGSGEEDSTDNDTRQGLSVPIPTLVYEPSWALHNFDKYSALKVEYYPATDEKEAGSYEYFLNMDNIHLKTELKGTKDDFAIVKSRWQFGMILVGIALLNRADQDSENDDAPTPEEEVRKVTTAIAPILLPMIEHLGALSEDD